MTRFWRTFTTAAIAGWGASPWLGPASPRRCLLSMWATRGDVSGSTETVCSRRCLRPPTHAEQDAKTRKARGQAVIATFCGPESASGSVPSYPALSACPFPSGESSPATRPVSLNTIPPCFSPPHEPARPAKRRTEITPRPDHPCRHNNPHPSGKALTHTHPLQPYRRASTPDSSAPAPHPTAPGIAAAPSCGRASF